MQRIREWVTGSTFMGLILFFVFSCQAAAAGPAPIALWPNGAPGAKGEADEDTPQLRVYRSPADRATGAGIVVCPGGGYQVLASDHEGQQVARWLNTIGVTAFVLKYRLGPRYRHPIPLQDAQRALRHVRSNADEYGVAADRIGIMGFSAGGHLAATAATHFDDGDASSTDPVARASCRPDFVVLGYPVISFQDDTTHGGSRKNLLGEAPDPELVELLSNEKQVTSETPPAFLFHTGEDSAVPVQNSLKFYTACVRAGVPAELHIYQFGPHGVGLAEGDPVGTSWKDRLADWLRTSGFLSAAQRAAVEGTVHIDGQPLRWGMVTFVPRSDKDPIAFAMVAKGNFTIPATRGATVGMCRIELRDLGAVTSSPTIETAQRLDRGELSCEIVSEKNSIAIELSRSQ